MKRLLLIVPLVLLLIFLNACGGDPAAIPDSHWTAMAETLTAASWTAVPTATFNPIIPNMVGWLNVDLSSPANALGATMDAEYSVTDITFPHLPALTFQVDVGCICMNNAHCCIPERTFVVILDAMKRNSATALAQIPADVSQMMVVCDDHQARSQIGAITVSWEDVRHYLQGYVDGHQLGVRITRTIAP